MKKINILQLVASICLLISCIIKLVELFTDAEPTFYPLPLMAAYLILYGTAFAMQAKEKAKKNAAKHFCFTIDDNIRFMKELTENESESIFDHPYTAMLRRLHEKFDLKIQLNLFYMMDGFDLTQMSDKYASEWRENSDWLKLSFHSHLENVRPYESSGYDEVFEHCRAVNQEIIRFSSPKTLAKTTTVHYCRTTPEGFKALADNGIKGLLGLFGTNENPRTSYSLDEEYASRVRNGEIVTYQGVAFASLDMIINDMKMEEIAPRAAELLSRDTLRVMIHEQFFYEDYKNYQPDFEEKLTVIFNILRDNGYRCVFFEDLL